MGVSGAAQRQGMSHVPSFAQPQQPFPSAPVGASHGRPAATRQVPGAQVPFASPAASVGTSATLPSPGPESRAPESPTPASQGVGFMHAGSLNVPQPGNGPQSTCEQRHVPSTHAHDGVLLVYAVAKHWAQPPTLEQLCDESTLHG